MHVLRYRRDDGYIALVMIMMIRVMQCNNDDDCNNDDNDYKRGAL